MKRPCRSRRFRRQQLQTTKGALDEAKGEIRALAEVIAEREGRIKELDGSVASKEVQAEELSSRIDSALKEMEKVRQELSLLKGEKAAVLTRR